MSPKHGDRILVSNSNNLVRVGPPPRWVGTVSQLGRWLGKRAAEDAHCRMRGFEAGPLLVSVDTDCLVRKPTRDVSQYGEVVRLASPDGPYRQAVALLKADPLTRRATMFYTGSTTSAHVFWLADNILSYMVTMRDVDAWQGFPCDMAWHRHLIRSHILPDLAVEAPVRVRMTLAVGLMRVYSDQAGSVADNLYIDRPPLDFKPAPCGYSQHG